MRKMPSRLLTEWIAFTRIENEEVEGKKLEQEAVQGVKAMRDKRGK